MQVNDADDYAGLLARCDAEIQANEAKPADVAEKAFLVAMGTEDWRAEKRLIERSANADR